MIRRTALVLSSFLLTVFVQNAQAQTSVTEAGNLTIQTDPRLAFPGGLFAVQMTSRRPLGAVVSAVFDGRRIPCFPNSRGCRALVPIPPTMAAGAYTMGIEVRTGGGRRRIPVAVTVAAREYPPRQIVVPEAKRGLVLQPGVVRDGREVQLLLRTETPVQLSTGPFKPPVDAPPEYSYGAATTSVGSSPVESLSDAVWGEYHRGMDYPVPAGTVVQAPAAGNVLMARTLPLTGGTLLIDHGQGVISAFFFLDRIDVREGQSLVGRTPVALAGETGIASAPHVHWAVYVHGVAVDPRVMESLAD